MTYAQITLAISDECPGGLEGFSPLSERLPAAVFVAAIEDGQLMSQSGGSYAVFVDLMDEDEIQVAEKSISINQAAQILGLHPEGLVSLGRQRLAQINDEDSAYVAAKLAGGVGTDPANQAPEASQDEASAKPNVRSQDLPSAAPLPPLQKAEGEGT